MYARRSPSSEQHRIQARQLYRDLADCPYLVGLHARDMAGGESIEYRADHQFPAADLSELALGIELFEQAEKGDVLLGRRCVLPQDPVGPGPLNCLRDQPVLSLSDYCRLMFAFRDAAAKRVLQDVLRPEPSCEPSRGADLHPFPRPIQTPRQLTGLLEKLVLRKLVSRAVSEKIMEMLFLECERARSRAAFALPPSYRVVHVSAASQAAHALAAVLELPPRTVALALFAEGTIGAEPMAALETGLLAGVVRWAQALPPLPRSDGEVTDGPGLH